MLAVDVTVLTNELKTKLQCKGLFAHETYSLVKAFMRKLQPTGEQHSHSVSSADRLSSCSSTLGALQDEFQGDLPSNIRSERHMV